MRHSHESQSGQRRPRIVVDLTPVLPGGGNGGLKLLALELVKELGTIAPHWDFQLLTARASHDELATLDSANVSRLCVLENGNGANTGEAAAPRSPSLPLRAAGYLRRMLSDRMYHRARVIYHRLRARPRTLTRETDLSGDLLFSPFLSPLPEWPQHLPVVSLVVDLQYRYYGEFFSRDDRVARDAAFQTAVRRADRLICISEYTRSTVLENSEVAPEKVETIHIGLADRLESKAAGRSRDLLAQLGVAENKFLLFPANFWRHKNHAMLITAYTQYLARNPSSDLKLVLTGANTGEAESLRKAIAKIGYADRILLTGYVSDAELTQLMKSCGALIYPSLFEGFGMPPLEAMAAGKPVLCSNVTSLPEIVGDAAIQFDPRRPGEIAAAIERFVSATPEKLAELKERGRRRVEAIGDRGTMARKYLAAFERVLSLETKFDDALHGVFPDGWTRGKFIVTHSAHEHRRSLKLRFHAPLFAPRKQTVVEVNDGARTERIVVRPDREQYVVIERRLEAKSGYLEFIVDPIFRPSDHGMGTDERQLGLRCIECTVQDHDLSVNLLQKDG